MISYLHIIYFFIVIIHVFSYHLPVSKCPEEDSLRKCLDQYYVKGPVHFRDNFVAYNKDLNKQFNKRVIIHFPVAFVHPIDVLDVQNTIKCAIKLTYPIVARSGGHSFEGYGLGDKDCYLIVDLVNLNKITIDITAQTAVVGTGNLIDKFYYEVNQLGFAFPAGSCPYVGVGGLIMGGGLGFLNRKFGLSSDNILDAQIVLANGTVVYNVKNYPELLWAIRGAGNAGYGIVTDLTLRIYPIQKVISSFYFEYDFDQIPLVFLLMNQLGSNLHQNLTTIIIINSNSTTIHGVYLGSTSKLQYHMKEFIKLSTPKNITYIENNWYNTIIGDQKESEDKASVKLKSFFIDSKGLSNEGVKSLMKLSRNFRCEIISATTLIGGGQINEIRRHETAFVHRGFLFEMTIIATLNSENNICLQELEKFSQEFQRNYTSYEGYQNVIDRQLDNWQ
ncbi:5768_t:CDS:2, partial [Gigaspora margarita]